MIGGRICFRRGTKLRGWQATAGSATWNWTDLGGNLFDEPFPVLNVNNAMSVFALGDDGQVWHKWATQPG